MSAVHAQKSSGRLVARTMAQKVRRPMKSVALVFAWVVLSLTCQKTVECTNTFFTIRNATSDLDIGCQTYLHRNSRPFNHVEKPILLHLDEECTDEDDIPDIFEDAEMVSVSCNCAQANLSLTSLFLACLPSLHRY